MSNVFEKPSDLKAITINGAIVVESEEDKRKRAEKRAQRKSRWDNSKMPSVLSSSAPKKAKNPIDGTLRRTCPNAITYVPQSPVIRDNPAALRERKNMLGATLDVNKTDDLNQTALYWAAAEGYKEIVKYLLSTKCDITIKSDLTGRSALHFCAERGDENLVNILLDQGADPASQDNEFESPPGIDRTRVNSEGSDSPGFILN